MNTRWSYKVVDLQQKMFGDDLRERTQQELDKFGLQGWELVSVVQAGSLEVMRLFLKKEN